MATPLYVAAQGGHLEAVKLLISKGANKNAQCVVSLCWLLLLTHTMNFLNCSKCKLTMGLSLCMGFGSACNIHRMTYWAGQMSLREGERERERERGRGRERERERERDWDGKMDNLATVKSGSTTTLWMVLYVYVHCFHAVSCTVDLWSSWDKQMKWCQMPSFLYEYNLCCICGLHACTHTWWI